MIEYLSQDELLTIIYCVLGLALTVLIHFLWVVFLDFLGQQKRAEIGPLDEAYRSHKPMDYSKKD